MADRYNISALSESSLQEAKLYAKSPTDNDTEMGRLLGGLHLLFHPGVQAKFTKDFETSPANRLLWSMALFHARNSLPIIEKFLCSHEMDPKLRDIDGYIIYYVVVQLTYPIISFMTNVDNNI